jgi:RimJ/RimL family protein N-acetyltransferase
LTERRQLIDAARMTELRTKRLRLRPFCPADAGRFVALAGDPAVARMTSDIPCPLREAEVGPWLQLEPGETRFAIEHEGALAGGVGYFIRPTGAAELGFWISKQLWGRGFATEAAAAVVAHGFSAGGLRSFTSSHFADNPASGRVLTKLGFERMRRGSMWCVSRKSMVETVEYWKPRPDIQETASPKGWRALFGRVLSSA